MSAQGSNEGRPRAGWLAVAGVLVTLLTASITTVVNNEMAEERRLADRSAADVDRLSDRRYEAYVDLLATLAEADTRAARVVSFEYMNDPDPDEMDSAWSAYREHYYDELLPATAAVTVTGSIEARELISSVEHHFFPGDDLCERAPGRGQVLKDLDAQVRHDVSGIPPPTQSDPNVLEPYRGCPS